MKLFKKKVPKITNIEVRENFVLRCTFNTGDIRDYDGLKKAFDTAKPDAGI